MNLQELQDFLSKVNVTAYQKPAKTFLEIARQPHYENVISNIYAFFFNVNEEHGLEDVFINSLIGCIAETSLGKTKSFDDFKDFSVETEFSTKGNGRIDLLLSCRNGAIIIENKIYHILNNDLSDYWSSVIKQNRIEEKTIGVVLSLNDNIPTGHAHFINISHLQLLNMVIHNIGDYLLTANEKYFTFLKDFYQNIKNLSSKIMKQEELTFVFDNLQKINEVVQVESRYRSFIKAEVEKAVLQLEGFEIYALRGGSYNESRLRYIVSKRVSELYFTIVFDSLFSPRPVLEVYIELSGQSLRDLQSLMPFSVEEKFPVEVEILRDFQANKNNWAHFSAMTCNLTRDKVFNLSSFITHKLEESKYMAAMRFLENKLMKE